MGRRVRTLCLLGCFVLVPVLVQAQATLTGVVRDPSGAVLPGVTVEASSPILIEKVRTAVSDGTGQYRIAELLPGTYLVTYALTGFSPVRREAIEVSGSGVITINVDMRVGTIAETITVAGETPIVDIQSTRRQAVLTDAVINTLPATRTYGMLLTAVPGVMAGIGNQGSMSNPGMTFFTAHGGRANEGRMMIDGLNVAASFNGGGVSTFTYDVANAEEMQVLVSGGLGEAENGGPQVNLVPKSGGNSFRGSAFYQTAGEWSSGNNIDDYLRSIGFTRPGAVISAWDISGSFGGPIKRDRLWFFGNVRNYGNENTVEGAFANLYAGDATRWDYARDSAVEARSADSRDIYSFRFTGQVTSRNRVSFSHEYQRRCAGSTITQSGDGACRTRGSDWIGIGTLTSSPESFPGYHDLPYYVTQATWSSPLSSRLLLEGGYSRFHYLWAGFGQVPPDGIMNLIPVTEQTAIYGRPNFHYRGLYDPLGFAFADNDANPNNWRATAAYVTGAHNVKFGYQGAYQKSLQARVANQTQMRYTFNSAATATAVCRIVNGVRQCPVSFGYYISPRWEQNDRTMAHSVFLQDQWTRGRFTLQGALRYDRVTSWAPAENNGTTTTSRFNPQPISFPRTVSVRGYNDITPRLGLAYDLLGNGKTALKVNLGKYLQAATNDENYVANNPARSGPGGRFVTSVLARGWTDGNGNRVVDCDPLNPARQDSLAAGGDLCAALVGNDLNFGKANPNVTRVNPDILGGWGIRPWDWQFGASVQHEVVPRVSVEIGYNRRWFGNFFVTDNTVTSVADYDKWTLTVPQHPTLPDGGSTYTYYSVNPTAAARPAENYLTFETDYGKARTAYWHGVDVGANARLRNGLTLQGGMSVGRGVRNTCDVTAKLPELLVIANVNQRFERCDVTEPWISAFNGLASYTVPKIDVLVSALVRSLPSATLGGGAASASSGDSLNANYPVPNLVVAQTLGRLPAGALPTGTTSVNLLTPGQLYGPERVNQVDVRFAKILRFRRTRADIGVDLYNLFNTNDTTGYTQTYDYPTNGATWMQPTTIVAPRFVRFNLRFEF